MLYPDSFGRLDVDEVGFMPTHTRTIPIFNGIQKVNAPVIVSGRTNLEESTNRFTIGISTSLDMYNQDKEDSDTYIEVDIPDTDRTPPKQLEVRPDFISENEVDIDPDLIEEVKSDLDERSDRYSDAIGELAKSMFALDDADGVVETIFRDGLNMEYERDDSVDEMYPHLFRLLSLELTLNDLPLDKRTKRLFMRHVTEQLAANTVNDMSKNKPKDTAAQLRRYLTEAAKAKGYTDDEPSEELMNTLGVRKSRG